MDRLTKYKESILKFIKENDTFNYDNKLMNDYVKEKLYSQDKMISIILLTIMNNRTKKKKISIHGYNASFMLEIILILIQLSNKSQYIKKKYGIKEYYETNAILTNKCYECMNKNIKVIAELTKDSKYIYSYIKIIELLNDKLKNDNLLKEIDYKVTNENICNDVLRWYVKEDKNLSTKYKQLKKIKTETIKNIQNKYDQLCEMAMTIGWLMGGGVNDKKILTELKNMSMKFSSIYVLCNDYENIKNDINNFNIIYDKEKNEKINYTTNKVINYGLLHCYESYIENKENLIKLLMYNNIYTGTLDIMISYEIEKRMDNIINNTDPSLSSSN